MPLTSGPGLVQRQPRPSPPARSTSALSQYRRFGSKKITGSSQLIACWIIAYASAGSPQATTRSPAVCTKSTSGDSL